MLALYGQIKTFLSMGQDLKKGAELIEKTATGGRDDAKSAYVVFPPLEKNDYPTTFLVPMTNNDELRDFVTTHKGNLINKSGIKVRFQQLAQEDVYAIFGPHYMGLENDPRTPKVRNKMREMSALLAVKNELNGDRQFHLNVMIHPHVTNEILLHKENPNAESATAFLCESSYAPLTEDVEQDRTGTSRPQMAARHTAASENRRNVDRSYGRSEVSSHPWVLHDDAIYCKA